MDNMTYELLPSTFVAPPMSARSRMLTTLTQRWVQGWQGKVEEPAGPAVRPRRIRQGQDIFG